MNGAIPAWLLMPHRTICDSNPLLSTGHFTLEEAEDYIKAHPDEDFRLLTDDDEPSIWAAL